MGVGAVEIAALPKIRSFVTVQFAPFGLKHVILREVPAPFSMGSRG